jgi:uncharacterized protein YkwD
LSQRTTDALKSTTGVPTKRNGVRMVAITTRPICLGPTRRARVAVGALLAAIAALAAIALLMASAPSALAADSQAPCADAHVAITQAQPAQMRVAVLCLVNQQRTAHGLPKLTPSDKLDRAAQGWTDSMVDSDEFTHGSAFMDRISATGFDWTTVGENIATGYETPASVVRGWMNSPGHCANILDPAYREVGTGVSARRIPRASTEVGTWTQDFGRLMGQPALSGNDGPANACYH